MNTASLVRDRDVTLRRHTRSLRRDHLARPARMTYRSATSAEAPALYTLIDAHREEGRLLPRSLPELVTHAPHFVVAIHRGRLVGCAELAPLSAHVAEVRSLVVDRTVRKLGIGRQLVAELNRRACRDGFERLCAFTHHADYFTRMGFSVVPHASVPEKIARDCTSCPLFGQCGQHAVVLSLARET